MSQPVRGAQRVTALKSNFSTFESAGVRVCVCVRVCGACQIPSKYIPKSFAEE